MPCQQRDANRYIAERRRAHQAHLLAVGVPTDGLASILERFLMEADVSAFLPAVRRKSVRRHGVGRPGRGRHVGIRADDRLAIAPKHTPTAPRRRISCPDLARTLATHGLIPSFTSVPCGPLHDAAQLQARHPLLRKDHCGKQRNCRGRDDHSHTYGAIEGHPVAQRTRSPQTAVATFPELPTQCPHLHLSK